MSKIYKFFCVFVALQGQLATISSSQSVDTPLILAVKAGNKKEVRKLLKSGIEVNSLGQDYKTALDAAVEYGDNKIISNLIAYDAMVTCHDNQKYLEQFCISKARRWKLGFAIGIGISLLLIGPNAGLLLAAGMSTNAGSMTFCYLALGFIAVEYVLVVNGLKATLSQAHIWRNRSEENWMLPIS